MSWGTTSWGSGSSWGTGETLPTPSISDLAIDAPSIPGEDPAADVEGGTVIRIFGNGFFDPIEIELLTGTTGAYEVVGVGYVWNPEFDLRSNWVYFGAPALDAGLYHLRVRTDGGESNVLEDAIRYRVFAERYKIVSVRGKHSRNWETGRRLLQEGI